MQRKDLLLLSFFGLVSVGCRTVAPLPISKTDVAPELPRVSTASVVSASVQPSSVTLPVAISTAPSSKGIPASVTKALAKQGAASLPPAPVIAVTPTEPAIAAWRSVSNTVFGPGERFDFVLTWGIITAGRSSLEIKEAVQIDGRPTLHLVSAAQSTGMVDGIYKVRDRNESWLDKDALSTVRYERHIQEGKYRLEEVVFIDQINHRFRRQLNRIDKDEQSEHDGDVPPNVLDVFGSLYYVRLLPLEVGKSYTIDVTSGKKVYPLKVNILKRETVKVEAGKFDCYRVEPVLREPGMFVSKGKKLEVWITADERRMPVLMRSEVFIGYVSAELTSFKLAPPQR